MLLRAHRRAQGRAAQPHRRRRQDRGHRLRRLARTSTGRIDRAEQELFAVSQKRVASGFAPLKALLHSAYDRLDYLHQHKGEISGIRTGFADLDTLTTGLQKSDLIILAARPSIGKTSLALNFAEHAAVREGKTVGIFSLEMSKEQLVLRLLSSVANIDSQRLRTGFLEEMDFTRLAPAMNTLAEAPIFIDDTPNISTMELRTKARRLQAESGLDLIIVDYLQLMQSTVQSRDANRVQEVSEISRGLKALARELQVPVVALSPAVAPGGDARVARSRACRTCASRGRIEQDCDLVMFLWREKERGADDQDSDGEVVNLQAGQAPQRPHRRGQALVPEAPDALRVRTRKRSATRRPTPRPWSVPGRWRSRCSRVDGLAGQERADGQGVRDAVGRIDGQDRHAAGRHRRHLGDLLRGQPADADASWSAYGAKSASVRSGHGHAIGVDRRGRGR